MDLSLQNLFNETESSVYSSFKKINSLLKAQKFIKIVYRERQYYDEPKFWSFTSIINEKFQKPYLNKNDITASGYSFYSKQEALLKAFCESIERYCNHYFSASFISNQGTYSLSKHRMISLDKFARYTPKQLSMRDYKRFKFEPDSYINFTTCYSLLDKKEFLVPCNFIYLSYPNHKNEPYIQPPISTGVALGTSLSGALVRGVCEVIERDAFMKAYISKTKSPKIDLKKIKDIRIKKLISMIERYNYKIFCLNLTSDINIPTIGTIILDESNIGKAISIGLKCHIDPLEAILGSITEAFHTRGWIRRVHEDISSRKKKSIHDHSQIIQRGLFWFSKEKSKRLSFWLNSTNTSKLLFKTKKVSSGKALQIILKELARNNLDVYWKNLTIPELSKEGFFVVKTIVPQLYPLTFDDKRPLLKNIRIHSTGSYNTYPHPFL